MPSAPVSPVAHTSSGRGSAVEQTLPIQRFTRKLPTDRLQAAMGPGTLCAVFVETDDKTGLARRVSPVRIAGRLESVVPKV